MSIAADIAQTFFIDRGSVKNSLYTYLNKVTLYFQNKPVLGTSTSGLPFPGVTVFICETESNNNSSIAVPVLTRSIKYGRKRVEWNNINTSSSGTVGTDFVFYTPVPVKTNTVYAIVIKFDGGDRGFSLWRNKAGETYNNVPSPSITKGSLDGYFFTITNGTNITPQPDVDLKFQLHINKFSTANTTYKFVNRNFELINYIGDTLTGAFIGGEYVFSNTGYPSAQTISTSVNSKTITGSNTAFLSDFTPNQLIILNSGTTNDVRKIVSVTNNTTLTLDYEPSFTNSSANYMIAPIGKVFDFMPSANIVTLVASTANTSHNFLANGSSNTLIGVVSGARATIANTSTLINFNVDEFNARFKYFIPPGTSVNTSVRLANSTFNTQATPYKVDMDIKRRFTPFPALLFSRTNEALFGNGSVGSLTNEKSINFDSIFSTDNEYVSPLIDEESLIFEGYRRVVNDDLTNEHKSYGNASSKYISKRITLAPGQEAEDIRVYATAFRPANTDVKLYVKFYNELDTNSFENRDWTLLETISPFNLYSNPDNYKDLIELQYKLFNYPVANTQTLSAGSRVSGTFTGTNSSANLVCSTSSPGVNTQVITGDLVRVYNPLFPNNSLVAAVLNSNTTHIQIDTTLASANTKLSDFVRSGLIVEKCEFKNMAYNDYVSGGIIKYYNSDMAAFSTYNTFALKIILTGTPGSTRYPLVHDIRGIAVSI